MNLSRKTQPYRVGRRRNYCRPYAAASAYAISQGIRSQKEWYQWSKSGARPKDIPGNPHVAYRNQWQGWGMFLGTNNVRKGTTVFRAYKDARKFAATLGFSRQREWQRWSKSGERPFDIPSNPQTKYKDKGWCGWKAFLAPPSESDGEGEEAIQGRPQEQQQQQQQRQQQQHPEEEQQQQQSQSNYVLI